MWQCQGIIYCIFVISFKKGESFTHISSKCQATTFLNSWFKVCSHTFISLKDGLGSTKLAIYSWSLRRAMRACNFCALTLNEMAFSSPKIPFQVWQENLTNFFLEWMDLISRELFAHLCHQFYHHINHFNLMLCASPEIHRPLPSSIGSKRGPLQYCTFVANDSIC